jgi:hypothetical protein
MSIECYLLKKCYFVNLVLLLCVSLSIYSAFFFVLSALLFLVIHLYTVGHLEKAVFFYFEPYFGFCVPEIGEVFPLKIVILGKKSSIL